MIVSAMNVASPTSSRLHRLTWSPWLPFIGGDFGLLPRGAGLYRVRVLGQAALAYIGQTGRDLR